MMKGMLAAAAFAATVAIGGLFGTSASAASVTATTGSAPGALDLSTLGTSGGVDASGLFYFNPINITSGSGDGNCGPAGGTCLQFNPGATTTMTTNPPGGTFDLRSLSFVLDGTPAELGVFNLSLGTPGTLIISADVSGSTCTPSATNFCVTKNTWYDLNFGGAADGVTSILFDNTGQGNVRIGNIVASTVPAVPLPATALLLLGGVGGLGGLGALRKSRRNL